MERDAVDELREPAGRGGSGWKGKELSLARVAFQVVIGHPSRNVRQKIREEGLNGRKENWWHQCGCEHSTITRVERAGHVP